MKILVWTFILILMGQPFTGRSQTGSKQEQVIVAQVKGLGAVPVYLVYGADNMPETYHAYIRTPICEERLCYPVSIDLYWDLVGNFSKYELPADSPLTKFDHVPFTQADHKKMYKILADKASVLGVYKTEDLIDKNVQKVSSVVVDAVTGATNPSVKNVVVDGALYSAYTLWHLVNGCISTQILKHTESMFSDQLLISMLRSDNYNLQYYALNKAPLNHNKTYEDAIVDLIIRGATYIPYFAIEKLPLRLWNLSEYQERLLAAIPELKFELQNELLNKFKDLKLSKTALLALTNNLGGLKDSQILKALEIVLNNVTVLTSTAKPALTKLLTNKNEEISTKAAHILEQHKTN